MHENKTDHNEQNQAGQAYHGVSIWLKSCKVRQATSGVPQKLNVATWRCTDDAAQCHQMACQTSLHHSSKKNIMAWRQCQIWTMYKEH